MLEDEFKIKFNIDFTYKITDDILFNLLCILCKFNTSILLKNHNNKTLKNFILRQCIDISCLIINDVQNLFKERGKNEISSTQKRIISSY